MNYTYWLLASLLATALSAHGADGKLLNRPLHSSHPVEVTTPTAFRYDGKTFVLDARHFLVDATVDEKTAQESPFLFRTFQDAVARLSDGTPEDPMVLYLAPYVYWVDDPDDPEVRVGKNGREPFGMTVKCNNLHVVGLTDDPRHVVLAAQRGQTQGAVGNFTMFDFHGDGLEVSNLTMGNFCNVDLDFPLLPALNRRRRSDAITQAHVAYCHGDRIVARNVRFVSRLNMNPLNGARRILFDHCHMECTDDALTGNGVYLHCDFDFYGQKPFYTTSQTGAVMLDCDFHLKGAADRAYFCKAPGAVTLVDCRFHSTAPVYIGWTAYPPPTLRCYYSNVTLNGIPYLVESEHPEISVCMDGKPLLSAFKTDDGYQIGKLLAGEDGWNPMGEACPPSSASATALRVSPADCQLQGGDPPLSLSARMMRHGGYSMLSPTSEKSIEWQVQKDFEKYLHIESRDNECFVTSDYDCDTPLDILLHASTPDGLEGASLIRLTGKPLPAPTVAKGARIKVGDTTATLDYRLQPDNHGDESLITWYLSDDGRLDGAIPVAASNDGPLRSYALKRGDAGRYLLATIDPRHARSTFGPQKTVVLKKRLKRQLPVATDILETDFHDFPCGWQPLVREGLWTVDGYKPADTEAFPWSFDVTKPMWEYGEGFNGAVGKGLLQAQRGARMMFTPMAGDYGGMKVELDVDPTKTAGQGFGSATGQYMDICLKFDTRTLTGYGLRIIRTTKYAKAVDFLLVGYEQGKTTPLTAPVSAICYRTGCHIRLSYSKGRLTAHVTTDTPLAQPDDPVLQTEVSLSAQVANTAAGGFCLQHTGSCGESTTMLHRLRIEWEGIQAPSNDGQ